MLSQNLRGRALGVLRGEADQRTGTLVQCSAAAEPVRITLALDSEQFLLCCAPDGTAVLCLLWEELVSNSITGVLSRDGDKSCQLY